MKAGWSPRPRWVEKRRIWVPRGTQEGERGRRERNEACRGQASFRDADVVKRQDLGIPGLKGQRVPQDLEHRDNGAAVGLEEERSHLGPGQRLGQLLQGRVGGVAL